MELYKKHRPTRLKDIEGQDSAVKTLKSFIDNDKVPHFILLTGPSGCGKTTIARILRDVINCVDSDFKEINCADFKGIDMVRDLRSQIGRSPIHGDARMWLIDEAHELTTPAQNAFLKMLEDTPKHVYFIMCTTNADKLLNTIKTRATDITLQSMSNPAIQQMMTRVLKMEGKGISLEVGEKIGEHCEGSGRRAMVLLDMIIDLEDEEDQLTAIEPTKTQAQAIEIFRALMTNKTDWPKMAALLKRCDEEPEGIRRLILACARNIMLSGKKGSNRAFVVIQSFSENYFETKQTGLVASCFEVIAGR